MTEERVFDRLVHFDEASREWPIREALRTAQVRKPRGYTWRCDLALDQGREGACVGYSVTHEAAARPYVREVTAADAITVYRRARQLDPWPGENYEGTSVLAGMKAAVELGWYSQYRWAFGLEDLILAVGYAGPAVLGVHWFEGMRRPDRYGYVHPSGAKVGGHAILCNGVSVSGRFFRLHNSWGAGWGLNGECMISFDDMEKLLHDDGEACIPVTRLAKPGAGRTPLAVVDDAAERWHPSAGPKAGGIHGGDRS